MPNEKTLLDKFYGIVDGYYQHSQDFKDVEAALKMLDETKATKIEDIFPDG